MVKPLAIIWCVSLLQLRNTCWAEQLFVPPLLEALLRLLELERQSCKW